MNERYAGNAAADGEDYRGWFVGHFLPPDDPGHETAVELKWGIHPLDDARAEWADDNTTTLALLVRGRFVLIFRAADGAVEETTLAREGDYVVWGPGSPHRWRAEEESIVLTVRWPSLPAVGQGG